MYDANIKEDVLSDGSKVYAVVVPAKDGHNNTRTVLLHCASRFEALSLSQRIADGVVDVEVA